jgi:capsular polysaccharide export protein
MPGSESPARWTSRLGFGGGEVGATSLDLCSNRALAVFLGARPTYAAPLLPAPAIVAGWGNRPSGRRAARIAARSGARLLRVEDGFLRSARRNDPPLSLVLDDLGIYYDAHRPSRLERLIAEGAPDPDRARRLVHLWRALGLSKIARLPDYAGPLPASYVLVLDQLAGDQSVAGGLAHPGSFDRMLQAARMEFPDLPIVLKTHPDTGLRRRRSHFDAARLSRVLPIAEPCHPARLIAGAEAVYTVSSQGGFEALLHDRLVRTFGMPFYAGWGLTEDDLPPPPRRGRASLDALVHAALVAYPRYIDPETGAETVVEAAMASLAAGDDSSRRAA